MNGRSTACLGPLVMASKWQHTGLTLHGTVTATVISKMSFELVGRGGIG